MHMCVPFQIQLKLFERNKVRLFSAQRNSKSGYEYTNNQAEMGVIQLCAIQLDQKTRNATSFLCLSSSFFMHGAQIDTCGNALNRLNFRIKKMYASTSKYIRLMIKIAH